MSTKQCYFAVERQTPVADILSGCVGYADTLDDPPEQVFAWIQRDEQADQLRWFSLFGKGQRRSFIHEGLCESLGYAVDTFVMALHDDQNGVFLFERHHKPEGERWARRTHGVFTNGHRTAVLDGDITADYPQKGFANEQLDAIVRKPEAEMTDDEARAVMEYHDAIRIGLDTCYPSEGRRYLSAGDDPLYYKLYDRGLQMEPPQVQIEPVGYAPILQFSPDPRHWREAGWEHRRY